MEYKERLSKGKRKIITACGIAISLIILISIAWHYGFNYYLKNVYLHDAEFTPVQKAEFMKYKKDFVAIKNAITPHKSVISELSGDYVYI
jgi:hypothetical protein